MVEHVLHLTGYSCTDTTHKHIKVITPQDAITRAHNCLSYCNKEKRKYAAYLMGYKCGCKKSYEVFDDVYFPVSEDCVDRMVCMELPSSVCLCGMDMASPSLYPSAAGIGPLLVSDKFHCLLMDQNSRSARINRIQEYGVIRKSRVQAQQCLDICITEQYLFAGISHGGECSCQNHVGHRKWTNADCWSTCTAGGTGCGGPYSTSVYSSHSKVDLDYCGGHTDDCNDNTTVCKNTVKTYQCECKVGYIRWNRTHCKDMDECQTKSDLCKVTSTVCKNTIGSFQCVCRQGYSKFSSTECTDIDECVDAVEVCGKNAKCTNIPGSFTCECLLGYTLTATGCDDVDECYYHSHDCDLESTLCNNTIGGFLCQCKVGYQRLDPKTCTDIDECDLGVSSCDAHKHCVNSLGSYSCDCTSGYKPSPSGCEDVDECLYNSHSCDSQTTRCINREGSYQCECKLGYRPLDKTHCQDFDECSTSPSICVSCKNTIGSFICECFPGYIQLDRDCVDVDECTEKTDACALISECENTVGSYQCNCYMGYQQSPDNPTLCLDIDECSDRKGNPCHADKSVCFNTPGSYTCPCVWGYKGDGRSKCSDVNECDSGISRCSEHAACTNTIGSYSCTCRPGFSGNGKTCKEVIKQSDLDFLLAKTTEPTVELDKVPAWNITQDVDLDADFDKMLNEMNNSPVSVEDTESPVQPEVDDFRLTGEKPDVKSVLNSIKLVLPHTGNEKTNSLDGILDDIADHEKAISHVTDSPYFVRPITPNLSTRKKAKLRGRIVTDDPVVNEAVSVIIEAGQHPQKTVLIPSDNLKADDPVLQDIMGDLNLGHPITTQTNIDMIMDKVIIHEEKLWGKSKTHTAHSEAFNKELQDIAKHFVDPDKVDVSIVTTPQLEAVLPANDLMDITEEIAAKGDHRPWRYNSKDDHQIVDITTRPPILTSRNSVPHKQVTKSKSSSPEE